MSWYGVPARRSAASTSNSHGSTGVALNAARRARSRSRASRVIRLNTSTGARSRSLRSRCQAATSSSTSSPSGPHPDPSAASCPRSSVARFLISRYFGRHEHAPLGPRALPDLRRRARAPVRRPAAARRCRGAASRRRPRLRRRQPDRTAARAVAGRRGGRGRLEPGDGRPGPRARGRLLRGRRRAGLGSPPSPSTCSSPTPPSSGSRAPRAAPSPGRHGRPGGWFAFSVPGNFAEPSHTLRVELAAEAPYAEHTAGVASPDAHDAATYLEVLRGLGLRGRRLGDDVPARAHRRGPRVHLDQRHQPAPDPAGAARGAARRGSRTS